MLEGMLGVHLVGSAATEWLSHLEVRLQVIIFIQVAKTFLYIYSFVWGFFYTDAAMSYANISKLKTEWQKYIGPMKSREPRYRTGE